MELLSAAAAAVREAGSMMLNRELSQEIREKSPVDYVTGVDLAVEDFLKDRLCRLSSNIGFLSEEQDSFEWEFQSPVWVLDPVDGTTNLIHDFHHSAVSLALIESGKPEAGIVYCPFSGEMFTARRGSGAFLNGTSIRTSDSARMADSLLSVGTAPGNREEVKGTFERMRRIFERCRDIRRMGAASLELCYVACGRLDGYFEEHLKPWDYAAGMVIVEEAGGTVCGRDGLPPVFLPDREIAATNGKITEEFLFFLRDGQGGEA